MKRKRNASKDTGIAGKQRNAWQNSDVAAVFATYPAQVRKRLLYLRQLILDTASETDGVGEIEETLRWGEPTYLTTKSKSGSMIRLGWKKSQEHQCAMHFHCQTTLVATFREIYPDEFTYAGNRSIIFEQTDDVPADALRDCIAQALTYHLKKKTT